MNDKEQYAARLREHIERNPSYIVVDFVTKKGWDRLPIDRCSLKDEGFIFLLEK